MSTHVWRVNWLSTGIPWTPELDREVLEHFRNDNGEIYIDWFMLREFVEEELLNDPEFFARNREGIEAIVAELEEIGMDSNDLSMTLQID